MLMSVFKVQRSCEKLSHVYILLDYVRMVTVSAYVYETQFLL